VEGAAAVAAVVTHALLLSRRAPSTALVLELASTRAHDLFPLTELLGALAPFHRFNQQVVTGPYLQSGHHEFMIANYLVLLALVVLSTPSLLRVQVDNRRHTRRSQCSSPRTCSSSPPSR
jgi:hypothetical protein